MFSSELRERAHKLVQNCTQQGVKITCVESCTGGLLSALITDISGASAVFHGSYVTYANEAKIAMLGVDKNLIEEVGAVSEEVARAMAQGALARSKADIAVAITGVAGPTGGTAQKPVGLVYISVATQQRIETSKNHFTGNRESIRLQSVEKALEMLGSFSPPNVITA